MKQISGRLLDIIEGRTHHSLDDRLAIVNRLKSSGFIVPDIPTLNLSTSGNSISRAVSNTRLNTREPVGTALKSRIEGLFEIKSGKGCGCTNLAAQMDNWGIAGCERERQTIINALMKHRETLNISFAKSSFQMAKAMGFADSFKLGVRLLGEWIENPDCDISHDAEIAGANWLLDQSINDVRNMKRDTKKKVSIIAGKPKPRIIKSNTSVKKNNNVNSFRLARRKSRGGMFGYDKNSPQARFITSAQLQYDTKVLLSRIPSDITAIAGVARSGLSVATMLSMYLHLPMITIRQTMNDVIDTGNGWRLGGSHHINPKKEKVLIVDDTVMTGNSIKAIKPLVQREFGDHLFAAVYVNPAAAYKPDIWAVDLPWPHILEWNVFNSILSDSIATDFDGILCLDCPPGSDDDGEKYLHFIENAQPLYVPRRMPVPLVVTARIEKYRRPTEIWLQKHGIHVKQLIMHPANTLRERERDDICAFKAMHFSNWINSYNAKVQPQIFFESEDWQARRIGQLVSGQRLVICPHTAGVY